LQQIARKGDTEKKEMEQKKDKEEKKKKKTFVLMFCYILRSSLFTFMYPKIR